MPNYIFADISGDPEQAWLAAAQTLDPNLFAAIVGASEPALRAAVQMLNLDDDDRREAALERLRKLWLVWFFYPPRVPSKKELTNAITDIAKGLSQISDGLNVLLAARQTSDCLPKRADFVDELYRRALFALDPESGSIVSPDRGSLERPHLNWIASRQIAIRGLVEWSEEQELEGSTKTTEPGFDQLIEGLKVVFEGATGQAAASANDGTESDKRSPFYRFVSEFWRAIPAGDAKPLSRDRVRKALKRIATFSPQKSG